MQDYISILKESYNDRDLYYKIEGTLETNSNIKEAVNHFYTSIIENKFVVNLNEVLKEIIDFNMIEVVESEDGEMIFIDHDEKKLKNILEDKAKEGKVTDNIVEYLSLFLRSLEKYYK